MAHLSAGHKRPCPSAVDPFNTYTRARYGFITPDVSEDDDDDDSEDSFSDDSDDTGSNTSAKFRLTGRLRHPSQCLWPHYRHQSERTLKKLHRRVRQMSERRFERKIVEPLRKLAKRKQQVAEQAETSTEVLDDANCDLLNAADQVESLLNYLQQVHANRHIEEDHQEPAAEAQRPAPALAAAPNALNAFNPNVQRLFLDPVPAPDSGFSSSNAADSDSEWSEFQLPGSILHLGPQQSGYCRWARVQTWLEGVNIARANEPPTTRWQQPGSSLFTF